MRRLSEVRFRRYADLDAQSIWAMIGRDLLLDVCEHLEREKTLPENLLALQRITPLCRELETETQRLFENKAVLRRAIAAIEGIEDPSNSDLDEIQSKMRGKVASLPNYEEYRCPSWCERARRSQYPKWS